MDQVQPITHTYGKEPQIIMPNNLNPKERQLNQMLDFLHSDYLERHQIQMFIKLNKEKQKQTEIQNQSPLLKAKSRGFSSNAIKSQSSFSTSKTLLRPQTAGYMVGQELLQQQKLVPNGKFVQLPQKSKQQQNQNDKQDQYIYKPFIPVQSKKFTKNFQKPMTKTISPLRIFAEMSKQYRDQHKIEDWK